MGVFLRCKGAHRTWRKRYRLIHDARSVNWKMPRRKFRLPSPADVALAAGEGAFFIVVDFSDFFFQIPLHRDSQKWTVADIGGVKMACTGLPQGLRLSPWVAQRLAHERVRVPGRFRLLGINSGGSNTKRDKILLPLVKQLGLIIVPGKGTWEPSQRIEYLGIIIDSVRKVFGLSEQRRLAILSLTQGMINRRKASVRELASIAGKIISTKLTMHHAQISAAQVWRSTRRQYQQKGWDHPLSLGKREIEVLESILTLLGRPNIEREWTLECAARIFVDASPTGYGGVAPNSSLL